MSKAIAGAAMIVGGAALEFVPGGQFIGTQMLFSGISMEAGAIAEALSSNRGSNITIRQPAAFRQIIYGEQRVGGVLIYASTTGSHHDQYNSVVVVAGHQCDSFVNLWLDGRKVFWDTDSAGYSVRNGVGFGGDADDNSHFGPDGSKYKFATLLYAEARYGDQLPGDVITGLTANDPKWAASSSGSPYVGGCAYFYLKTEYHSVTFPSRPEIRITVRGKNDIWDPRTNTRGYTDNWALCVADVLMNTEFGLGLPQSAINIPQLIAAANTCDELVPVQNGADRERRYTCNAHYDTSTGPGDILADMMSAAGGRLSFVGGQWYIWPAVWIGASTTLDQSSMIGDGSFTWDAKRSEMDLVNRVRGTYVAPNFPFAIAGNFYDADGDYHGTVQDNFNYQWQRTDFPQYAQDTLHGYASDAFLAADSGITRVKDLSLNCTISCPTAQRLAKIELLRNRQQGSGTFTFNLSALRLMPMDVIQLTLPIMGWTNKLLEVTAVKPSFHYENGKAPTPVVEVTLQETDPSVYVWNASDELTPSGNAQLTGYSYQVSPPTAITYDTSQTSAYNGVDKVVIPRIKVSWTNPADAFVSKIQTQFQAVGDTTWIDGPTANVPPVSSGIATGQIYIPLIVANASYNVQIRSVRYDGGVGDWVTQVDGSGNPVPAPVGNIVSNFGGGGFSPRYYGVNSNYSATPTDYTIGVDASGGARTITLPGSPTGNQIITVTKTDASANSVTVTGTGGFSATLTTTVPSVTVQYTGSGWIAI